MVTCFHKKISGPLMDRLDILVDVPWVDSEKLTAERRGETSETNQRRVEAARERQAERFMGTNLYCDALPTQQSL
jgi:magnesium chelatase family protein